MCRLFGLSASPRRVHASFWLLEAPDSLALQSRRNPDGTGLSFFSPGGEPVLDKEPLAASEDVAFSREARHVSSTTFVSHIRFATTGECCVENTHPYAMDGKIFAHNGVLGDLERLEAELGDDLSLVQGQTDSERYFALVTREIRANGGDVGAGVAAAVGWIVDNVPVYAINFVLASEHELWAFRYPETHELFVLERPAGGHLGEPLRHESEALRIHSEHLGDHPAVVVASEPLDGDPGWRPLEPGELAHVKPDLSVSTAIVVEHAPTQVMHLDHPTGQERS